MVENRRVDTATIIIVESIRRLMVECREALEDNDYMIPDHLRGIADLDTVKKLAAISMALERIRNSVSLN